MKRTQQKIYIDQQGNDKFFEQKLATWRDGYCYINRTIHNIRKMDIGYSGHIVKLHQENVKVWSLTMTQWELTETDETELTETEKTSMETKVEKTDENYLQPKDAAKLIRKELKVDFKDTKFSVKTELASMTYCVDIKGTDGPTEVKVKAIVDKYQGASFDPQQDLSTPTDYKSTAETNVTLC